MSAFTQRFWLKVDRNGPAPARRPELGPCWLWRACADRLGYGVFKRGGAGSRLAHVIAWEMVNGPVPRGLELDHLCRNPPCVNPAHLEPVTHRQNMARSVHATKTHCVHGHPFDAANTQARRDGSRCCRVCARDRKRGYAARQREAAAKRPRRPRQSKQERAEGPGGA